MIIFCESLYITVCGHIRTNMYKLAFFPGVLMILLSGKATAQGMVSVNGGGSIGVSYTLEPQRKFKDATGGYQYSAAGINARIPLFRNKGKTPGHFFETSLQADLQTTSATFGFINNSRNFLNGSLGLGGIIYNGGKNILVMNAAIGLAADKDVIDKSNTRYRFSGAFIVNHQHSIKTVYQYGIAFTYAFGKPLPLPILGIRTKLPGNWTFSTILPVEVSFIDKLSSKAGLSFSIRPAGNRYQFDNQANFSTSASTVFLQLREFQVGAAFNYKCSKEFILSADAGFLLGGKMQFTEQDDPKNIVFTTGVKPGGIFRVSARYRFPRKTENMRGNKMNDLLNPLGN